MDQGTTSPRLSSSSSYSPVSELNCFVQSTHKLAPYLPVSHGSPRVICPQAWLSSHSAPAEVITLLLRLSMLGSLCNGEADEFLMSISNLERLLGVAEGVHKPERSSAMG